MPNDLINDATEEIPAFIDRKQLDHLFTLVPDFPSGTSVAIKFEFQGIGIHVEQEAIAGKYYSYTLRGEPILGTINGVVIGEVTIGGSFGVNTNDESPYSIMLATDADIIVNDTSVTKAILSAGIKAGEPQFTTNFSLESELETREDVGNSERTSRNVCDIYLSRFNQYAEEILKRENIEVISTQIRNWQAIDVSNWKQCILDIKIKAEPDQALSVWEKLVRELEYFISTQDSDIRPLLEDNLTVDVRWVQSGCF